MTIQFFLVLFFETKYDLYGTCALGHLAGFCDDNMRRISVYQLHESSNHTIQDPLEYMRRDIPACYGIFSNAFLIATHLEN